VFLLFFKPSSGCTGFYKKLKDATLFRFCISKLKYMPLRLVRWRIQKRATQIGPSIFCLTVGQPSSPLTASIKALDSIQINSKLIWDFHQSLAVLAEHNRI
jgi:hypothetical protein